MICKKENVNVQFHLHIYQQIIIVLNVMLQAFGFLKQENVKNVKILIYIVIIKIDVSVLKKLLINFKENVLIVFNHNIGTLLPKNVKIVHWELIIHIQIKFVKPVLHKLLYGMVNIA